MKFAAGFYSKVDRSAGVEGCHLWKAAKRYGYGAIKVPGGKVEQARRVAFALSCGPIPKGLVIMHLCDNRGRVNPLHLRADSQKENILDAFRKGRLNALAPSGVAGEEHPMSKITRQDAEKIRRSAGFQRDIAARFGISQQQVSKIKNGKRWR